MKSYMFISANSLLAFICVTFVTQVQCFIPLSRTFTLNGVSNHLTSRSHHFRTKLQSLRMISPDDEIEFFDPFSASAPLASGSNRKTRELPLFPLPTLACPTGMFPLHIFEMRYRQLFNAIADKDNQFGLVLQKSNRDANELKLAAIGTLMEVQQRQLMEDGRQLTVNMGKKRFRLLGVKLDKPYAVGIIEEGISDKRPVTREAEIELIEKEMLVWYCLQDVIRLSRELYSNKTSVRLSDEVIAYAPNLPIPDGEKIPYETPQYLSGGSDPLTPNGPGGQKFDPLMLGAPSMNPDFSPWGWGSDSEDGPGGMGGGMGGAAPFGGATPTEDGAGGKADAEAPPPAPAPAPAPAPKKQDISDNHPPLDLDRCTQFSFAVAEMLDITSEEKQVLLQTTDAAYRYGKQLELLDTARAYLIARVQFKRDSEQDD